MELIETEGTIENKEPANEKGDKTMIAPKPNNFITIRENLSNSSATGLRKISNLNSKDKDSAKEDKLLNIESALMLDSYLLISKTSPAMIDEADEETIEPNPSIIRSAINHGKAKKSTRINQREDIVLNEL